MKLDNANDINKVKVTEALSILFPCEDKKKKIQWIRIEEGWSHPG